MASLDSFLNTAIPIGIIVFFCGMIYWKLKEPLDSLFKWLKDLFSSASDKVSSTTINLPTEIVYK
jgi:hypothetical protein